LDSGMETTARNIRLNRLTGEVSATGDVRTSYSQLKSQPGAAWLASSGPMHITADSMTARNTPPGAIYKGHARLWQDANFVEAPTIEFQKDQRTVTADSDSRQNVMTALISLDKKGKATPVNISSRHLKYSGADRRAQYSGSVIARSEDLTIASDQMDVFFEPSPQPSIEGRAASPIQSRTSETPLPPQALSGSSSKLDKIVATGSIVITQPTRHATGEKLTYTAADDKFILTGGPPSIFDAEHGKITGVSLTLLGHDDRVIVDGNSSSPAVTETRVVR
jgi:lipopolysaccharide export system protein LptA